MTNLKKLRYIRKMRKRRSMVFKVSRALAVTGFILMANACGEGIEDFGIMITTGIGGSILFGIGVYLRSIVDTVDKERPLVYRPFDKEENLWYTMYISNTRTEDLK